MVYPPVEPNAAHAQLMDSLHGIMGHPHIRAQHKADYAKAQSILAALQARMHAEPQTPGSAPGQMGGVQAPEDSGFPAGQIQNLPYTGYGALPNTVGQLPSLAHPAQGLNLVDLLRPTPVQAYGQLRQPFNPILAALHHRFG